MIGKLGKLLGFGKDGSTAVDPVCDMEVDTSNPPGGQSNYRENTYYFCAPGCKHAFDQEPEKYLNKT